MYIAQKSAQHSNVGIVGAAYCAMLLGWLTYDTPANTQVIRCGLPASIEFSDLASTLKLFMSFQLQAGILPDDVQNSLTTIIKFVESL